MEPLTEFFSPGELCEGRFTEVAIAAGAAYLETRPDGGVEQVVNMRSAIRMNGYSHDRYRDGMANLEAMIDFASTRQTIRGGLFVIKKAMDKATSVARSATA